MVMITSIHRMDLNQIAKPLNCSFCINASDKMYSPVTPSTRVMMSWLKLPAMVSDTDFNRLPSSTKSIRPPYSPILLGVFIANDTPVSVALKARRKGIRCMGNKSTCHFLASIPQLININTNTIQNFQACAPYAASRIYTKCVSRSGCCLICLTMEYTNQTKMSGPRK